MPLTIMPATLAGLRVKALWFKYRTDIQHTMLKMLDDGPIRGGSDAFYEPFRIYGDRDVGTTGAEDEHLFIACRWIQVMSNADMRRYSETIRNIARTI